MSSLRVAAAEFVPSWAAAPAVPAPEAPAEGVSPVAGPAKSKSLFEIANSAQEFVPSWLPKDPEPVATQSSEPAKPETRPTTATSESAGDEPSEGTAPKKWVSRSAESRGEDSGDKPPPIKEPSSVHNYSVPAPDEARRVYHFDLMKPLQDLCKYRPAGMEESPPGCGYELGDGRSVRSKPTRAPGGPRSSVRNNKSDMRADVTPLTVSENRWRRSEESAETRSANELVVKNVRGILNKLTTANFERLFQQIIDCGITSAAILSGVIDLVYDKAVTEHTFSALYAQLCLSLCEKMPEFEMGSGQVTTFRKILLRKCQYEFENRHVVPEKQDEAPSVESSTSTEGVQLRESTSEPEKPAEPEASTAEEIEIKRKQRVMGNVKFVGELYKKTLLSEDVMHGCIYKMFGGPTHMPEEEELEALTKLITTIGKTLEEHNEDGKRRMDMYFARCAEIARHEKTGYRVRFMLQDLGDLRKRGWQVRAIEAAQQKLVTAKEKEAAKKVSEQKLKEKQEKKKAEKLKKERDAEKKARKAHTQVSDDGWAVAGGPATKASKGRRPQNGAVVAQPVAKPTKVTAGGFAALMGGDDDSDDDDDDDEDEDDDSNDGADDGDECDDDDEDDASDEDDEDDEPAFDEEQLVKKTKSMLEEFMSSEDLDEAVLCVQELKTPSFHPQVVMRILTSVLERKDRQRELAIRLLHKLAQEGVVTTSQLHLGIEEVGGLIEDLEIDIPFASKLVMQMLGKLIGLELLHFDYLPQIVPFLARSKLASLLAELCTSVEDCSSTEKLKLFYATGKGSFSLSSFLSNEDIQLHSVLASLG